MAALNSALRTALEQWPGLDGHPDLLVGLVDPDDALTPSAAADRLLAGIARPHTPSQAVTALTELGEYGLAAEVAERTDAREGTALVAAVADGRTAWQREAEARLVALRAQAEQAGATAPETLPAEAFERRVVGETALDRLERKIDEAMLRRRAELETRREHHDVLGRSEAAFERCLAAGQLEAAQYILDTCGSDDDAGTPAESSWPAVVGGALRTDPAAVPQPRAWPWSSSAEEVLSWIEDGGSAPLGFSATRAPPADDETSAPLIRALAAAPSGPLSDEVRAALDAFVGVTPRAGALGALDDPLLAPLLQLRPGSPILYDDERTPPAPGDDALVIRLSDLLAMLADVRTRRVALLRVLGRQLALDRAIDPATTIPRDAGTRAGLQTYVAWLLDLVGLIAEPAVPEVLVWLAGGEAPLALVLLRETLARSHGGERRLKRRHLLAAYSAPAFLDAAQAHVRELVRDPVGLQILRAIRWLDPPSAEGVAPEDLLEAIGLFGPDASPAGLEHAVAALGDEGLLERRSSGYALSARAAILVRYLGDS